MRLHSARRSQRCRKECSCFCAPSAKVAARCAAVNECWVAAGNALPWPSNVACDVSAWYDRARCHRPKLPPGNHANVQKPSPLRSSSSVVSRSPVRPAAPIGAAIEALLKFPLINSQVPQAQVESFCEKRVPKVPKADSLKEWEQLTDKWRADMFEKVIFSRRGG